MSKKRKGKKLQTRREAASRVSPEQRRVQQAAKAAGVYVLFDRVNGVELWRIYDARATGHELVNYWPSSGSWVQIGSENKGKARPYSAIRIAGGIAQKLVPTP